MESETLSTLQGTLPPPLNMKNSITDDGRISNLPDDLLSHILSFLPTKQAFTTTLLSKRWAPLCYSLSVLEFNDRDFDNDTIDVFYRFVDKLMLSSSAINQPIKTFDLMCRSSIYNVDPRIYDFDRQNRFDAWVEAAKQRSVEEFHLEVRYITLNSTIFTSKTLVVLKLNWLDVKAHNFYVDLPSLKTLHLRHVCFENPNDFMNLLNACPILQDLHTYYPRNPRHNIIHEVEKFKSFFLSKLVRADISSMDVPFNAICNVEFLHIRILQNPFKAVPMFRNLIHIHIWFSGFFHGWYRVVELLQHCPKLQILNMRKLNSILVQELECPISVLECVSSHLRSCTILNFEGSANDLRFATYVLQNARVLQDMTIDVTTKISNGRLLEKSKIIEELSLCPRISIGCKLSFN